MKRWLICLGPWMAMAAAAAQEAPRQTEVVYAHYGPAIAWKLGDECFVAPNVLAKWGWTYVFVGSEATIQAEGRTLKLPSTLVESRLLVPLKPALEQLGAGYQWRADGSGLDVWGVVTNIKFENGALEVDATIAGKPTFSTTTNPDRLVVDFAGVRLSKDAKVLVDGGTVKMADASTLRVSIAADPRGKPVPEQQEPTRNLKLDITEWFSPLPPGEEPEPPGEEQTKQPSRTGESQKSAPTIVASIAKVEVVSQSERLAKLKVSLSAKPAQAPRIERPDPARIELILPGVEPKFAADTVAKFDGIESWAIAEDPLGARLSIQLSRPMAAELTLTGTELSIQLYKPAIGSGRLAGKVILLDAGHGGVDGGARSPDKKLLEKSLALAMTLKLSELLLAEGATVVMSRTGDQAVPLKERPEIGNRNKADIFISIHLNSNKVAESRSGSMTFYHKKSKMGQVLAECVQKEIAGLKVLPSLGARSDGTLYQNGLAVLRLSKMPSILIETGFLNHATDRKHLNDPAYHSKLAGAIVKGLKFYFGEAKNEG